MIMGSGGLAQNKGLDEQVYKDILDEVVHEGFNYITF